MLSQVRALKFETQTQTLNVLRCRCRRHVVPPAYQRTFAEKWLELREHVKKGNGNVQFTLSKVCLCALSPNT